MKSVNQSTSRIQTKAIMTTIDSRIIIDSIDGIAAKKFTRADYDDLGDTSLMGYLYGAGYKDICGVLGEPEEEDCDKVPVLWGIKFDDGLVVSIYAWEIDPSEVSTNREWNIGGRDSEAITRVGTLFPSFKIWKA